MARPVKYGIDSFPFDVSFFTDPKVKKVVRVCGVQSSSVIISLLCYIYRNDGYYMLCNEENLLTISEETCLTFEEVSHIVEVSVEADIFVKDIYCNHKVLTSEDIQRKYLQQARRRKVQSLKDEYRVIDDKNSVIDDKNSVIDDKNSVIDDKNSVIDDKNSVIDDKNSVIDDKNSVIDDKNSNQQKEKERTKEKEKEIQKEKLLLRNSKKKNIKTNEELLKNREKVFYDSLRPYVGTYKKEMIRRFYDYWTEQNRSGTKMRFELEKTFEISKRLKTWSDREGCYKQVSSTDIGVVLKDNSVEKYSNEDKWNR